MHTRWQGVWSRYPRWAALLLVGLLLEMGVALLAPLSVAQAATETRTGVFATMHGDPEPGASTPDRTRYFLHEDDGTADELLLDDSTAQAAGGVSTLDRQRIVATVQIVPGPRTADAPLVVQSLAFAPGFVPRVEPRVVTGSRKFLNALCKFADVAAEPQPQSYFDSLMSSADTNGLDAYWREVSYGQINLAGSVSTNWVQLPHAAAYYVSGSNPSLNAIASDCLNAIPTFDPNAFQGINIILNSTFGCCAWGGYGSFSLNGTYYGKPMTWMPPWGYTGSQGSTQGVSVLSHEMGHAFGLLHSGNNMGTTYKNAWDVMSYNYYGCSTASLAQYGCLGQHIIGYDKNLLGWIPTNRRFTYAGGTRAVTLAQIEDTMGNGYLLAILPGATGSKSTTIEYRHRVGRDTKLPGDAVIIHDADSTRSDDTAWVRVRAGYTGDVNAVVSSWAMFTEGQAYNVAAPAVTVMVRAISGASASVVISNGIAPTVSGLNVTSGSAAGGANVILSGANLSPEATVSFGSTPVTNVVVNSNGTFTVTTPALPVGTYPVTVTNQDRWRA